MAFKIIFLYVCVWVESRDNAIIQPEVNVVKEKALDKSLINIFTWRPIFFLVGQYH